MLFFQFHVNLWLSLSLDSLFWSILCLPVQHAVWLKRSPNLSWILAWCLQEITSVYHFLDERDESVCVCMCVRVQEKERWLASHSRKHLTFAVSPQVFVFHELTLIKITGLNAFPRTIECASSIRLSDFLLLIGAIGVGCLAAETEQNCSSALGKAQCTKCCVLITSFTAPTRLQTEEEMEFSWNYLK